MSWNNSYAAAARAFFGSPAGQSFIEELDKKKPKINSDSIEKSALSAHRVMGFEDSAAAMEELINFNEKPDQGAQPRFIN